MTDDELRTVGQALVAHALEHLVWEMAVGAIPATAFVVVYAIPAIDQSTVYVVPVVCSPN